MAFAVNSRRVLAALLTIAVSSLLFWFGNGLNPLWPLVWFAPLLILIFAMRNSWQSTALVAFFSLMISGLSYWHYLHVVLGGPFSAWLAFFSIPSLALMAAVLLFRALLQKGAAWSALFALPTVWVSWEYLRNFITPHGTLGSLAYSQLSFLPFLQLASITGPWGMSFMLMLFPAALAIGLHLHLSQSKQAWRIPAAVLGAIALVLIFGAVRLAQPGPQSQVTVGLVTSDGPATGHTTEAGPQTVRQFTEYAAQAESLSARGAQVVVLPEEIGTIVDPQTQAPDSIFQSTVDRTGSTIVAGILHVSPTAQYDEARIYTPQAPVLSYDKHHMLPPFESNLKPGTTITVLSPPAQTWGVAICKDMDFTPLSRQYGQAGAGLMLVPGGDFNLDRAWHGHIAIMRGVEDGFSVARAAKKGYLTVSDDRGRILAQTQSDSAPFPTLLTEVPATHDATLYLLLGDWFAWLALAVLVFILIRLWRLRRSPLNRLAKSFPQPDPVKPHTGVSPS